MRAPRFLARMLGSPAIERRDASVSEILGAAFGYHRGAGGGVTAAEAEGLAAVASCTSLICSTMSTLPASLVVDGPDGPAPAPRSAPAWRRIARPNEWQTWGGFVAWMSAQYLLQGNALVHLQVAEDGTADALVPVNWAWCSPQIIRTPGRRARLVYDVMNRSPQCELLGIPARLLDSDVAHVRNRSDDGIIGRSVLSRAAGPVGEGLEIAKLADRNWRNSFRTSGIVGLEGSLSDAGRARLREQLRQLKFSDDANVLILDQNARFTAVALTSVDQEFLASRQYSTADICRLFNVPEPLLQIGQRALNDLAPFTTAFAQQCLAPIVTAICSEFDNLLPEGMHLSIDLDGLSRGSFATTVAALASLKQSAIITGNDGRAELGWPPHPDGNVLAAGPAPAWPADGPGSDHLAASPGPRPAHGLATPGTNEGEGSGRKGNGKANGAHAPGGSP